jgi:hypothetical protein
MPPTPAPSFTGLSNVTVIALRPGVVTMPPFMGSVAVRWSGSGVRSRYLHTSESISGAVTSSRW